MSQYTYILAPSFRFKPGGPIALGNLIADPLRPHRALTKASADTLETYPRVETTVELDRTISSGASRDLGAAVWAQFMDTVTARLGGEVGSSGGTRYGTSSLETSYFIEDPVDAEIEARVADARVAAYMRADRLVPGMRRPVYLVTGVMVARDFVYSMDTSRRRAQELELGGDVPNPVGTAGAGVSFKHASEKTKTDSWSAKDDIVFAYQLLKIESKGWRNRRIEFDQLRSKHAVLDLGTPGELDEGDDGDDGDDDGLGPIEVCVAGAQSLDQGQASEVVKELENGVRVVCVVPSEDGPDGTRALESGQDGT